MARHIPRLHCPNLSESFEIEGSQAIHLVSVLRLKENDEFFAFNQNDGEWLFVISKIKKQIITVNRVKLIREFQQGPKLALAFCLIKQDNSKLIIEKSTELGVTDFYPLVSQYSNSSVNVSKFEAIARGAAEQSERLDIPVIHDIMQLDDFINNLPDDVLWISAVERQGTIKSLIDMDLQNKNCGFIIGPEGGFSEDEKKLLLEKTRSVTISKNILRAETAAISCLSVYNAFNVF